MALIRRINEADELRRWAEEELRTLLVIIATVCKRSPRSVMVELVENHGLWALEHAWSRESASTMMVERRRRLRGRWPPPQDSYHHTAAAVAAEEERVAQKGQETGRDGARSLGHWGKVVVGDAGEVGCQPKGSVQVVYDWQD